MKAIDARVLAGLEEIAGGLAVFDEQLKLAYCNALYPRIRDYPAELCRPGITLAELFHYNAARGDYGDGDAATHVAERIGQVRRREPVDVDQTLGDGRILASRYRSLADGGLLATYEDVTEARRSELGAAGFRARHLLEKPCDPNVFAQWVQNALAEAPLRS